MTDQQEVKRGIPLTQALPFLLVIITAVLFGYDLKQQVAQALLDPMRGSDMDRFVERLQVSVDEHCREAEMPSFRVRGWRSRERSQPIRGL